MIRNLSIKKKIVIWFTITFLLNLSVMMGLTFVIGQSVFDTDIKTQLRVQVDANAEEIEFLNSSELEEEYEKGDQFLEYNKGYLEIDDDFCDYINGIYTCLVDSDNNLLYGEAPVRLTADQLFTHTVVEPLTYQGEKYYIYERQLHGHNLEGLWLRGVASLSEGTYLLQTIAHWVLLLVPVMAALSVLGAYIITRRSFAPAEKIIEAADSISSGNDLSRRIELPKGRNEFHTMADSYNRMFDRLDAAFQREKQFTSDVSHELRTPVSVILTQSEFSLEMAESEEDYREALEVIQQQGLKMKDLISQLLFFSRLEQGREPLQIAACNLSSLVSSICDEQEALYTAAHPLYVSPADSSLDRESIKAPRLLLLRQIPDDVIAPVDSRLFGRAVTNLLSNAYKYSEGKNGYITVSLLQLEDPSRIQLHISDQGIGIPKEHLEKIFDRFYQVDPSRTASQAGSDSGPAEAGAGLGLSMVREIVHLHNGSISVESRPGEGTTFTVTVPAAL